MQLFFREHYQNVLAVMTISQESTYPLPIAEKPLTIAEMVVADYRKAEVFRQYGIDYCCGGKKPLEEVCLKKNIDPAAVWQALQNLDKQAENLEETWTDMPLQGLTAHIVGTHHQYVLQALPMLNELTTKVARVHGERHPELIEIARHFFNISQELQMHMQKEENILFPFIEKMAAAWQEERPLPPAMFGSVSNPIHMMESEHESAGNEMEIIRQLSDHFTPPAEACTSYRVLFAKLEEFERDLHRHVHLENNILFPHALQLEQQLHQA